MSNTHKRGYSPSEEPDSSENHKRPKKKDVAGQAKAQGASLGQDPTPHPPISNWLGLDGLTHLVVFGDSYSASVAEARDDSEGDSDEEECADPRKSWAQHLATWYSEMELHSYAVGGHTAEEDLQGQVDRFLLSHPRYEVKKCGLDPSKTLYVLWMGINDCGTSFVEDLEDIVDNIMDAIHQLYVKRGARNFLVLDVPPMDRSPGGLENAEELNEKCTTWNTLLHAKVTSFANTTPSATVVLFSAHQTITHVLENPKEFVFTEEDVKQECAAI